MPILNPPKHPDRICTNHTSVTFPIEAGAKLAQDMQYGTEEWQEIYASDRNTIESTNAFLNDGAHEGIGDAARRRMHGYTAQYVLITFLVAAGNLRKIDKFAREHLAPATPQQKQERRKRTMPEIAFLSSANAFAPYASR
jgi:hypothetical protein